MAKIHTIKKDVLGLYVNIDGYICRCLLKSPTNGTIVNLLYAMEESRYNEGDQVEGSHRSGTVSAGIGKDESCKKGKYLESWVNSISINEYQTQKKKLSKDEFDQWLIARHNETLMIECYGDAKNYKK